MHHCFLRRKRLLIASAMVLLLLCLAVSAALWPFTRYFVGRDHHCSAQAKALLADPHAIGMTVVHMACANSRCLLLLPKRDAVPDARGQALRAQLPAYGVTPAPYGELQGIVVMLHGKGSCKENLVYPALRMTAAGLAVMIPDLPGHGDHPQDPSGYGILPGESDIAVQALQTARAYVQQDLPAALWGHSMGSSFANYTVAAHPDVFAALVIQAGFERMDQVLRNHLPGALDPLASPLIAWFRVLVNLRGGVDIAAINPSDAAASHRVPVLQIHGRLDRLIPYARGEALAQAYRGEKHFISVPDGDHNDALYRATPVFAPVIAFMLRQMSVGQE